MVTGPMVRAWDTASEHPPSSSSETGTAVMPAAWRATSSRRSRDLPTAATRAPRSARASVIARPMPLLPPVTRATRPLRSRAPASAAAMHDVPESGHDLARVVGAPRVPAERDAGGARCHRFADGCKEILAVVHPRATGDQHRHPEAGRLPERAGRLREGGLDHVCAELGAGPAGGRDVHRFVIWCPGGFAFGWHDLTHVG